ncbi:hypothetical protein [Maribacter sp. 2210JD10-5]|uniref:hypothetical protein n=1 Tax=Maribacter sp. 2210JD10-5 TaxID=3386272 RepID=UPI0039BD017D
MEKSHGFPMENFLNLHSKRLEEFTESQKEELRSNPPEYVIDFRERQAYLYQQIIEKCDLLVVDLINENNIDYRISINDRGVWINIVKHLFGVVSATRLSCIRDFDAFANELFKELFK